MRNELEGRRVLVTGATGFIGGRLTEVLCESGAEVRALVRDLSRMARLARYDVEIARGDVLDRGSLRQAAAGCGIVVHCAYGKEGGARRERRVNVEGTRNVIRAAVEAGAERVVHLSTMSVYGVVADGDLDETLPRRPLPDVYSRSKAEAERLALGEAARGAPVTVLQPTVVYGPFAPAWTVNVLAQLESHRVMLVDGGRGIANVVYVDDLVEAILAAAVRPQAVGEAFLVSGPEAVTWRRFYRRYEEMLGFESTVEVALDDRQAFRRRRRSLVSEMLALLRQDRAARERLLAAREPAWLLRMARRVVPERLEASLAARLWGDGRTSSGAASDAAAEKPVLALGRGARRLFAARSTVRIDKARRLLGYQPRVDFEQGMGRTEAWARWANLLPAGSERSVAPAAKDRRNPSEV